MHDASRAESCKSTAFPVSISKGLFKVVASGSGMMFSLRLIVDLYCSFLKAELDVE